MAAGDRASGYRWLWTLVHTWERLMVDIRVESDGQLRWSNGVSAGSFYKEVDGYYVWAPPNSNYGSWYASYLHEIADLLDEMNQEWDAGVGEYFTKWAMRPFDTNGIYKPQCGSEEEHMFHTEKQGHCAGLCLCNSSHPDIPKGPHSPGEHK